MAFGTVTVQEDICRNYAPYIDSVTKQFKLGRVITVTLPMLNNDAELKQAIENAKEGV